MRDRSRMSDIARLVTAEELERFPDDDYRYELVEGRIIRMSPVGFEHGRIVARFIARLEVHAAAHGLGAALTEVGFKLRSKPDTVRAPDVAFIRQERIPPDARGFWKGPPDLAVEVLSPDDRDAEIREKVEEYLTCGVPLVVVVDPDRQSAAVFRPGAAAVLLGADDDLDLGEVVDGFRCKVREFLA